MKILKWILYVVLSIVALLLIVAAFLPNKRTLSSSIVINSYPRQIYNLINSPKNWEKWSPFQEADPNMVNKYSGPEVGVGAHQDWDSKTNGKGNMTIVESVFEKKVVYSLSLMEGSFDTTLFVLERLPEGTKVTWETRICNAGYPIGRLMWMVFGNVMTKTFDKGLVNLKKVVENLPPDCKTSDVTEEISAPRIFLTISGTITTSSISTFLGEAYGKIGEVMKLNNNIKMVGAPAAFYNGDPSLPNWTVIASIPVNAEPKKLDNGVQVLKTSEQKMVTITHFGDYGTTSDSYYKLEDYINMKNLQIVGNPIEEYITDPMTVNDPMKIESKISFPVK